MRKLSLLLTLLSLLACRSPQEATQTVIRIRPTPSMEPLVKSYETQVISLPHNDVVSEERVAEVRWPVKRTFVPQSSSSNRRFRFVFTARGENEALISTLAVETEIVPGASRYLYLLLNEKCRVEKCNGGVCQAQVKPAALRTSVAQAELLETGCEAGMIPLLPAGMAEDMMTAQGDEMAAAGRDAPTLPNGTMTAAPPMMGVAADGGSTTTTGQPDAGTVTMRPPDTDGACAPEPCGEGTCNLKSPDGYECTCNVGFEFDEAAGTCVPRNDCKKDNGGCEDLCTPDATTGEARCSCEGPNRWLKGDEKQCAEVQPELELTTSGGSVDRTRPQVAFDPAGNGVVVWAETSPAGSHSLWAARFRADTKQWELPTRAFMRGTTNAADLHLALDQNGSGVLIWTATVSGKRQLWASRYSHGEFDPVARPVEEANEGDVLMPSMAIDALGDGLVVWTDAVYPKSKLRGARYLASSDTFSHIENLAERGDSFVFGTSVAVTSVMSGLVAWTDVPVTTPPDAGPVPDFTGSSVFSSRVDAMLRTWTSRAAPGMRSTSPDVALDTQGNGVGVWVQEMAGDTVLRVVSSNYVPGTGWAATREVLSERGDVFSSPRIVMGGDGSVFSAWRETAASASTTTQPSARFRTYGALRTTGDFGPAYELGLPSDTGYWNDIDPMAWTPETTVTLLDYLQPMWSIAVGPDNTGFIAGASFSSTATPPTRELWLQRVGTTQEPYEVLRLSGSDAVPSRPSPVKLGMNGNGDGAVVWDRQIDGNYHVFVNLLD